MASSSHIKNKKGKQVMEQPKFDEERFKSHFHQLQFTGWMIKKEAVPEAIFKLENDFPAMSEEIHKRRWEVLCDPPTWVSLRMVQKFYANAVRENEDDQPFKSYVRGVEVDFSPKSIRKALKIKPRAFEQASYEERLHHDPQLEDVASDICMIGTDWKRNSKGRPRQLRRGDLISEVKGWYEFVRRLINPTSNTSEVTINRAIMVHCIMKGRAIDVPEIVAASIQDISKKNDEGARLGHPSIIHRLCERAGMAQRMERKHAKVGGIQEVGEIAKLSSLTSSHSNSYNFSYRDPNDAVLVALES
ncbi:hypothetical protein AHAS_Ahas20G0106400 [Arachis hypogaea]